MIRNIRLLFFFCLILINGASYAQGIVPRAFLTPSDKSKEGANLSIGNTPYKEQRQVLRFYGFASPVNNSASSLKLQSLNEAKELSNNIKALSRFNYSPTCEVYGKTDRKSIISKLDSIAENNRYSTVILFFSGHGIYEKEKGRYYFVASDTRKNDLESTGINSKTIQSSLERLAQNGNTVILFLDTCYSGAFLEGFQPRLSSQGSIGIFTACSSNENSNEYKQLGGSPYSQALSSALNGFISKAVDNNGNITYHSLEKYLEGKTPDQNPQFKLFGRSVHSPIFENVYEINDYLHRVERYENSIEDIKKALDKDNFAEALTIAGSITDPMSIHTSDRNYSYSKKAITRRLVNKMRAAKPEDIPSLVANIPYKTGGIADPGELNEYVYLTILGDAWMKNASSKKITWEGTVTAGKISNWDNFHKAMDCYISAYDLNPSYSDLNQSLSKISLDKVNMTKGEIAFLMSLQSEDKTSPEKRAALITAYIENFGASMEYYQEIIQLWENAPDNTKSKTFAIYTAQAYIGANQIDKAKTILAPFFLNNPNSPYYHYSDFKEHGEGFVLFLSTLSEENCNSILKEKEKDDKIKSRKSDFEDFLDSAFLDTPFRFGFNAHSGFKPFPVGGSLTFGYSLLYLSAEYTLGQGRFKYHDFGRIDIDGYDWDKLTFENLNYDQWSISAGITVFGTASLGFGIGEVVTRDYETTNYSPYKKYHYRLLKPEVIFYFPLGIDRQWWYDVSEEANSAKALINAKLAYWFCPQNPSLEGMFIGIGLTFQFGTSLSGNSIY